MAESLTCCDVLKFPNVSPLRSRSGRLIREEEVVAVLENPGVVAVRSRQGCNRSDVGDVLQVLVQDLPLQAGSLLVV